MMGTYQLCFRSYNRISFKLFRGVTEAFLAKIRSQHTVWIHSAAVDRLWWLITHHFLSLAILDTFVKSHQDRHPGEGRGPEVADIPGFQLMPE
jgi:hypothetical protein